MSKKHKISKSNLAKTYKLSFKKFQKIICLKIPLFEKKFHLQTFFDLQTNIFFNFGVKRFRITPNVEKAQN